MNILIDIRCLQDQPLTGVGEYTLNFLHHTLENDRTNKYFLFSNSWNGQIFHPAGDDPRGHNFSPFGGWSAGPQISNNGNVEIIQKRWPNKLLNLCLRLLGWPKIDKLVKAKIDLLILPNWNFAAWSKEVKTRLIAHDLSFEFYPEFFSWKRRLWHKLVNPRKLCKKVDEIIAVSENTKRDLINLYGIYGKKIRVECPKMANGAEQMADGRLSEIKKKYHLSDEFILYLGTIEPRKNLVGLIKAFELFKKNNNLELKLVVAGKKGWLYNDIYRIVSRSRVRKDIQFIGFVETRDKPLLYQMAKLFVYPSFYEGYGFPHREANQEGTPSIISQNSSLVENNLGDVCLVDPYNIQSLADLISGCVG